MEKKPKKKKREQQQDIDQLTEHVRTTITTTHTQKKTEVE